MDTARIEAHEVVRRCRKLAEFTEEPGHITRTFLSAPMRDVHAQLTAWMEAAGLSVSTDAVGNLRGFRAGQENRRLLLGSHIDTVRHAGAFDGVLGVVLAISLAAGNDTRFGIEVIAFSEEEGVRFGVPFIGSRALAGTLDQQLLDRKDRNGISVADAIRAFGLDPAHLPKAKLSSSILGYFEFHIEQGPVLESMDLPLGIVDAIAGQSRGTVRWKGSASHAGTTPMHLRRDALTAAAEWITSVESYARRTQGLVATIGYVQVDPGCGNVVPGEVLASLDVRHFDDAIRLAAVHEIRRLADQIAQARKLSLEWRETLCEPATPMDAYLIQVLQKSVEDAGYPVYHMVSGAGHDAMVLARQVPAAMLFVRSPGGVSHHPDETVLTDDIAAALIAGQHFLRRLDEAYGRP